MDNLVISTTDMYKENLPKITDFDLFLPWACNQLCVESDVIITRVVQTVNTGIAASKKKQVTGRKVISLSMKSSRDTDSDDVMKSKMGDNTVTDDGTVVQVTTIYNYSKNLTQLQFLQNKKISRQIMKVIGLTLPYHQQLNSIIINSGLNIDTLYEMAKILPDSNITELCLDNTFLTRAHYHILLTHGKLKHLSLARCSINDAVVKMITDQLIFSAPASKVLTALNLSTNRITDVGAKYIADMLRSNRQLSYLNLAGNMITDEGGMTILDTLQKFLLESQEFTQSRARYVAFLKSRDILSKQSVMKYQSKILKSKSMTKSKFDHLSMHRSRTIEKSITKQEKEIESFDDPFSFNNTESQDGVVRCFGNNTLCYLNLAYNKLSYVSVRKLLEVLLAQKSLNRTPKGLVRVVIEGNLMPVTCKEYEEINRLFGSIAPR